jgi:hypothetical protein
VSGIVGHDELHRAFRDNWVLRNIGELNGESSVRTPLLQLDYNNNGLGELAFTRMFDSEQEINSSGPNAIRMYTWLIQVVTTFFLK